MPKLIFLRHADTQKDPSVNTKDWCLSEKGKQQAEDVARLPLMDFVDVIYVSEERKTSLTVEPLLKKLSKKSNKQIDKQKRKRAQKLAAFNEVKRGDKFLTKEEFEAEKVKQLQDLSFPAFGGESGMEALARFKQGIKKITIENTGKTILIVTHGTILNIYFADLLNVHDNLSDRWSKTAFGAVGVVENGVVVQDIVDSIW